MNAMIFKNGLLEIGLRLVYCPARYAARLSQAFTDAVFVEV